MTELSPAARAIVEAFDDHYELHPFEEDWQEQCLAAALRELAGRIYGADHIRADIIAIADELENT